MGNFFIATAKTNYAPVPKKAGIPTLDNKDHFPEYHNKPEYDFDLADVPHIRNGVLLAYWLMEQANIPSETVSQASFLQLLWSLVDSCEQAKLNYEGVNRNEYFVLQSFHATDEFTNRLTTWSLVSCPIMKTVYLVFRGTRTVNDVMVDSQTFPISSNNPNDSLNNVHAGFYIVMQSVVEDIYDALSKFSQQHGRNDIYNLYSIGNSEGGALAQVFSLMFEKRPHPNFNLVKTITFAAPLLRWVQNDAHDIAYIKSNNTADSSSKKYKLPQRMAGLNGYPLNHKVLNIINNNDLVPSLPFATKFDIGVRELADLVDMKKVSYSILSTLIDPFLVPFAMKNIPDVVLGFRPLGLTVRLVGSEVNKIRAQSLNNDFGWFMKRRYYNDGDHHNNNYLTIVHTYFHR